MKTKIIRYVLIALIILLSFAFVLDVYRVMFAEIPEAVSNWVVGRIDTDVVKAARLENLSIEARIRRIFGKDSRVALAIFKSESGLNCKAVSKTNDHGIAQLHNQPIYDCTLNLLVAKEKFNRFEKAYGDGFLAWSDYKNKKYKRYLD